MVSNCANCGEQPTIRDEYGRYQIQCVTCGDKHEGAGAWFITFPWIYFRDAISEWNKAVEIKHGIKK